MRSFLTILGISVGIAAVVLLTSIGEGIQQFTLAEFTQFGTNLIGINPGRSTTLGTSGAIINNVRPLSIADEESLRRIPGVVDTVVGNSGQWPHRICQTQPPHHYSRGWSIGGKSLADQGGQRTFFAGR